LTPPGRPHVPLTGATGSLLHLLLDDEVLALATHRQKEGLVTVLTDEERAQGLVEFWCRRDGFVVGAMPEAVAKCPDCHKQARVYENGKPMHREKRRRLKASHKAAWTSRFPGYEVPAETPKVALSTSVGDSLDERAEAKRHASKYGAKADRRGTTAGPIRTISPRSALSTATGRAFMSTRSLRAVSTAGLTADAVSTAAR
jgi:hypothetical protein